MSSQKQGIWWGNVFFFVVVHFSALGAILFVTPWKNTRIATLVMALCCYQIAMFGITMGYHRLWTHRAFTARKPLRIALAAAGTMGFQGSIRWWVVRHRLHHRYTDDPVHDPYAATRGLFHSHVGWIFIKPDYPRLNLVDKRDLDRDIVVRLQHRHYVPLAIFMSFVLPTVIGALWGDPVGGFVWGGLVARIAIWHCVFLVNSVAHWHGPQHYTDEMSARGDWILAALTAGEGNHNFHAFPSDYRNGPFTTNWDPSRWIIWTLHRFTTLIPSVHRTSDVDVLKARLYMLRSEVSSLKEKNPVAARRLEERASKLQETIPVRKIVKDEPVWGRAELEEYVTTRKRQVLLIEGHAIDITSFSKEHPGGAIILREHLVLGDINEQGTRSLRDATQAFLGKFNNHTRAARDKVRELSVATIRVSPDESPELL